MISDNSVSCVFNGGYVKLDTENIKDKIILSLIKYKNDQEIRIELTPFELMEILRIIKIILCTMGG